MLLEIGNHIYMQEIDWGHITIFMPTIVWFSHILTAHQFCLCLFCCLFFFKKKYLDAEGFIFYTTNTVPNFSSVVMLGRRLWSFLEREFTLEKLGHTGKSRLYIRACKVNREIMYQ